MNEVIKINPKEFGLESKNVKSIEEAFLPKITERNVLAQMYDEIVKLDIDIETCSKSRELRLKLVKVRTGISDIHKSQKAFFLASGKFVDAWKNKETLPVTQMEDGLNKIEKHFEIIEEEKREKVRIERNAILAKYDIEYGMGDISQMTDDVWRHFLNGVKSEFEAKKEAEKKAEAERIAKEKAFIAEQKRIRAENESLKKEAELKRIADEKAEKERQRLAKIEQDKRDKIERERQAKAEAERKQREEKEAKERAIYEAELKKEREEEAKDRAVLEVALTIQREASERIQKELDTKIEVERKIKEDEQLELIRIKQEKEAKEEEERIYSLAPVKDKLKLWIKETEIKDPTSNEMDKETFEIVENIMIKFNSFKKWAESEIDKLK